MSQETTYLELSEVDGAHKFYEVIVDNATLTVRYGRIGDQGQIKASAYPDNARARAAAAKKIGEKVRKGYAPAVPGVRQKRTVSRRQIVSTRSTAHTAPVLWRYDSGAPAFGIFVDGQHCMVGNEHGVITTLDHDAQCAARSASPTGSSASSPTTPGSTPAAMTATSTTSPARCPGWRTRSLRRSTSTGWTSTTGCWASRMPTAGSRRSTTRTSSCGVGPGGGARRGWCGATATPSTTAIRRG
nr:WGR domain-containing protein [Micromonospora jinlongensis]